MTTTVVKSIGSAVGSAYPDIQAFWAAMPYDLVTADEAWVAEYDGAAEVVVTSATTFAAKITDATRNIEIRCASGKSYTNYANILTEPFVYNASRGVAIRGTYTAGNPMWKFPSAHVKLTGLQLKGSMAIVVDGSGPNFNIEDCIVESLASGQFASAISSPGGRARNTHIILSNTGSNGVTTNTAAFYCENVTITRPSNFARGGNGFNSAGSNAFNLVNCAVFGAAFSNNAHLGTNNASDGTIPSGAVKLENLVYANQFVSTTNDFRTKGGANLINAGAPVSANNVRTISGNRIQGAAPDIGAWELYVQASRLMITGYDGSVGNANEVKVFADGELTADTVVSITASNGTLAPSTLTLTPAKSYGSAYHTASASGKATLSISNNKGLTNPSPLDLYYIVAPILKPTPSTPGNRVVKIGSGTGMDFPSLPAFNTYLATQNLIAQQEMLIAECYDNISIGSLVMSYGVNQQNEQYYCIVRPVKGLDVHSRTIDDPFNYGQLGIEINVGTLLKWGHGVVFENFRITAAPTAMLQVGGPNGSSSRASAPTGPRRNRIMLGLGFSMGEYSALGTVEDNLFFRSAGTPSIGSSVAGAKIRRNTFVGLNGTTGYIIDARNNSLIEDNLFINIGDTPINNPTGNVKNNFTNMALATPASGITATTSPIVVNAVTDLRPVTGSIVIGKAGTDAVSKMDNRGANRGITPDAGAFQLVPAPELPLGVISGPVVPQERKLVVNFTTTNNPITCTASLEPTEADPKTASTVIGLTSLTAGAGTATFENINPGRYRLRINLSNNGGDTTFPNASYVFINGLEGRPQASRLSDDEVPVEEEYLIVYITPGSVIIDEDDTIQLTSNVVGSGPVSQEVNWTVDIGTIDSNGLYTPPANVTEVTNVSVRATSIVNPVYFGNARITIQPKLTELPPTVTGVVVSPSVVTSIGESIQFSSTVLGTSNPSQAVEWKTEQGTITSTGLMTPPASLVDLEFAVTATSVLDPTKSSIAVVTLKGSGVVNDKATTASIIMVSPEGVVQANLSNLECAFYDQTSVGMLLAPTAKTMTGSTDAEGRLTMDIRGTQLKPNELGRIIVSQATKAFTGIVVVK